jgi:hypothetical protein
MVISSSESRKEVWCGDISVLVGSINWASCGDLNMFGSRKFTSTYSTAGASILETRSSK